MFRFSGFQVIGMLLDLGSLDFLSIIKKADLVLDSLNLQGEFEFFGCSVAIE